MPKKKTFKDKVVLEVVRSASPFKQQSSRMHLWDVGHSQESLVRLKHLERERQAFREMKWDGAYKKDRDLHPRDEPELLQELRHKYI